MSTTQNQAWSSAMDYLKKNAPVHYPVDSHSVFTDDDELDFDQDDSSSEVSAATENSVIEPVMLGGNNPSELPTDESQKKSINDSIAELLRDPMMEVVDNKSSAVESNPFALTDSAVESNDLDVPLNETSNMATKTLAELLRELQESKVKDDEKDEPVELGELPRFAPQPADEELPSAFVNSKSVEAPEPVETAELGEVLRRFSHFVVRKMTDAQKLGKKDDEIRLRVSEYAEKKVMDKVISSLAPAEYDRFLEIFETDHAQAHEYLLSKLTQFDMLVASVLVDCLLEYNIEK